MREATRIQEQKEREATRIQQQKEAKAYLVKKNFIWPVQEKKDIEAQITKKERQHRKLNIPLSGRLTSNTFILLQEYKSNFDFVLISFRVVV